MDSKARKHWNTCHYPKQWLEFLKVELQNGCLALAHSNLFIPSTLGVSSDIGKVDKQKYTINMDMATDVYTNHCPCGETVNLDKGADSLEKQE